MRFEARVLDPARREVQLRTVEAEDEAALRVALAGAGVTVLTLRAVRGKAGRRQTPRSLVHPASEMALLCRELRALLQAGLSVVEALDALGAAAGPDSIYQTLLGRLHEGKSLSVAMQAMEGFPPLLVASVRASERTSDLTHALDAYLRFDDMVGGLRRKVVSAALYPALVVGLGGLIAIFLLLVVVPRFASLYGESSADVSAATQAVLAVSAALSDRPWLAPTGLMTLVGLLAWMSTGGRSQRMGARVIDAWPWLGRQLAHFERARLYEALALLVHGGYSLHEALGVCLTLAQGARAHEQLADARRRIEQGASASVGFGAAGLTDSVTDRLVRAGERGGEFDRVLRAIAERHRQAFETFVERATRIVEPMLLLGVALMIGSMVVLLYMPVFDIAASVR